ncbi:uncharacterized protein HfgLR_01300 [Haloferax gibbonsii]|uniref:Uncharacterized protein n=1 Tax=Haloferax gibbonsii TaxID=35746 RepID=A0A871BCC9_HALGI|nr:uncharacterized protein HfgLR_01300 [Haloferax gibbonsii]
MCQRVTTLGFEPDETERSEVSARFKSGRRTAGRRREDF